MGIYGTHTLGELTYERCKHQLNVLAGVEDTSAYIFTSFHIKAGGGTMSFAKFPIFELPALCAAMDNTDAHAFEWIDETLPLKMFFDFEMEGPRITTGSAAATMTLFLPLLADAVKTAFGVELTAEDMILTNSTRPGKLSYHLVVHRKIYFENMASHKVFIQFLEKKFKAPRDAEEAALMDQFRWTRDKKTGATENRLIFDNTVYKASQKFRIVGQSKFTEGPARILEKPEGVATEDTLVRLYRGSGDRQLLHTDPLLPGPKAAPAPRKTRREAAGLAGVVDAPAKFDSSNGINFVAEGVCLMQQKGLSYADLIAFPACSQYLHLIPNTHQEYGFYNAVCFNYKIEGGARDEFVAWAKLSSEFAGEAKARAAFEQQSDKTKGLPFLKKYAKLAHPGFFSTPDVLHAQYYTPDYAGFETLVEKSAFVSQEGTEWELDIMSPHKFVLLRAELGAGKTTAIERLLRLTAEGRSREKPEKGTVWDPKQEGGYLYPRVLVLSPRCAFAMHIAAEFGPHAVANYMADGFQGERLVCSLESLHRLPTEATFDLIVIDECEAILKIFSSATLAGRELATYHTLTRILNHSKKAIFAGAFITRKTVDFMRAFDVPRLLIDHQKPVVEGAPVKRAIEIDPRSFIKLVMDAIEAGLKLYIYWDSRAKLEEFLAIIATKAETSAFWADIKARSITYKSGGDDDVFNSLNNIDQTWDDASLVMATPSITVGNSYAPKHPDGSSATTFDQVYIYGHPSCIVADTIQGHKRIRHTKSNIVYFAIPSDSLLKFICGSRGELVKTMGEYDSITDAKRERIVAAAKYQLKLAADHNNTGNTRIFYNIIEAMTTGYEATPAPLRALFWANEQEDYLSATFFRKMFICLLVKCGYAVEFKATGKAADELADADASIIDVLLSKSARNATRYEDIIPITASDVETLRRKIASLTSTAAEKEQLTHYFFNLTIDPDLPQEIKSIYYNVHKDPGQKNKLRHMQIEAHKTIAELLGTPFNGAPVCVEALRTDARKLAIIRDICERLGLKHSRDISTFSRATLESLGPYLLQHRAAIHAEFGFKDRSNATNESVKCTIELLDKIFGYWVGADVIGNVDKRQKRPSSEYRIQNMIMWAQQPHPYQLRIDNRERYIDALPAPEPDDAPDPARDALAAAQRLQWALRAEQVRAARVAEQELAHRAAHAHARQWHQWGFTPGGRSRPVDEW